MEVIKNYLEKNNIKKVDFGKQIGVSSAMLHQMLAGIRPVPPVRSVLIEKATQGEITRQQLHPDDWQDLWPELKTKSTDSADAI